MFGPWRRARRGLSLVWIVLLSLLKSSELGKTPIHLEKNTWVELELLAQISWIATNAEKREKATELRDFPVNVISTFLLALLMLPKLRETATKFNIVPYLVIVSSEVHFWTTLSQRKESKILDALADKSKAEMSDRYLDTFSPSLEL